MSVQAQKRNITIHSTLTDSITNASVPFATIRIFTGEKLKKQISSLVSDQTGSFTINLTVFNRAALYLEVSHNNYHTKVVELDFPSERDSILQISTIPLISSIHSLEEVIVKTKKLLVETNPDGISFNVSGDPSLETALAIDALRKTPFVSITGNEQISVNGKPTKILMNGRSTGILSNNPAAVLNAIPANLIKKIEVITNPSAKYDAEGYSAVINIISKKISGYSFSNGVHFSTGAVSKISVVPSGSFKFGKFGLNFSGGHTESNEIVWSESYYQSLDRTAAYSKRNIHSIGATSKGLQWGSWELSLDIDSVTYISGYGGIGGNSNRPKVAENVHIYDNNNVILTEGFFKTNKNISSPYGDAGLDFIKLSKKTKRQQFSINTNLQWSDFRDDAISDQINKGANNRFVLNNNYSKNRQFTVQTDYNIPLTPYQSLDIGAKVIFRNATSDYQSFLRSDINTPYIKDIRNSDYFTYEQQVSSMYLVYRLNLNRKNTIQPGIRLEHTNLQGRFIDHQTSIQQLYSNIFPSLSFARNLGKGMYLRTSFSKRISRPGIKYLNPFINNYDSLNISFGNPNLQPEFTNSYDITFSINRPTYNISFSAGYDKQKDLIAPQMSFDVLSGVASNTYNNQVKADRLSVSSFLSYDKGKFSGNLVLNGYYYNLKNKSTKTVLNEGFTGRIQMNVFFFPSPTIRLSLNSSLMFPTILPQGSTNNFLWYSVFLDKSFFGKRLSLVLGVNNIAEKYYHKRTMLTVPGTFKNTSIEHLPYRLFQVGIIFRINKLKENVSRKRGVSVDDIKN
ncbi:outer membrane beta-barrel family protein [Sediminibacterium sp. KACHI17]|uniref:Outer membrane beta-barrel family protein n=1 Tax=Sediminibacterium sp. KACHI17 TaxID=1751071 RepID=A0AAT9GFQ7_9BACT